MKEKIQRGGGEEREDCIYVSILPWWDLSNERGRRGKCGCFSAYVNAQLQLLSLFEFPLKEEECERGERRVWEGESGIEWKVRRAKWKRIEECKIINILRWNGIRLPIPIVDCPAPIHRWFCRPPAVPAMAEIRNWLLVIQLAQIGHSYSFTRWSMIIAVGKTFQLHFNLFFRPLTIFN